MHVLWVENLTDQNSEFIVYWTYRFKTVFFILLQPLIVVIQAKLMIYGYFTTTSDISNVDSTSLQMSLRHMVL